MHLGIRCAAHVLNTAGNRTFSIYKAFRTSGCLTAGEIALIDHAKDVLDTAQFIANNVRGLRKVTAHYFKVKRRCSQVVLELGHKPTRGADTRWLSMLDVCRDITRVLDRLVQMKQDPEWAKRMGKPVVDAVTKLNGLRNELSACTSLLTHFEEPVKTLQVEFRTTANVTFVTL